MQLEDELKVMIVEDEALIGISLEKVLGKMGYRSVGVACSGEEAILLAFSTKPDVILMDVRIKGDMDGIDVSERINMEMSVPVVFLTAYNDDRCIDRCVKTGSYGFLSKPASSQEIRAAIEIAVSRHRTLKAEEDMRKKESVLKAVGFAAEHFLSDLSFEEGMEKVLSNLGELNIFGRVCLYENGHDSRGSMFTKPRFLWDSLSAKEDADKDSLVSSFIMSPEICAIMMNGGTYSGITENMAPPLADFLRSRSVASFLLVPVYAGERWWGVLGFETPRSAETWSEGEIEGLSAAATLIGSAIQNRNLSDEIRSREKKYRSLYNLVRIMCDNVPDMIWAEDPEGRYKFANRRFCDGILHTGDTGDVRGRDIHYYINKKRLENPPDKRLKAIEEYASIGITKNKNPGSSEEFIWKTDIGGESRYLDIYKAPFYDSGGEYLGIVGCARDVTKEKKFEDDLIEINSRFTAFMDQLPACAFIRDSEGRMIYANQYTKDAFGIGDVRDMVCSDIFGDICIDELTGESGENSVPFEKEGEYLFSDNRKHTLKFIVFPIYAGDAGRVTGAIATDITESKRAESALRESEKRYRSVIDNSPIGIEIYQDGKIVYASPSLKVMLGFETDEIMGSSLEEFVHPDDLGYVQDCFRKRLAGCDDVPDSYDLRVFDACGNIRILGVSVVLIIWEGRPATLNFLIDNTEKVESTKVIEKALLEKTILLQEVHHRVKNNLALINSLLSMQSRATSKKDVTDSLKDAEARIFSIAAVHEGLYRSESISTIPAGEHFLSLGEEVIENYAPEAIIRLDVDAEGCRLGLGGAIPVSLIVNELLTNSIKYAFPGRTEGRIYIKMECSDDSAVLIVGDDGVGISEDFDLEKSGTLGMTLVRNIVERQLEGTVRLERGGGTRWVISLPHL